MTQTEIRSSEPAAVEWYALSAEEVAARLGVDGARGLSAEEAARRLEQYGPNELESKGGPHPLRIFLRQFANILVIVLIVAALVSVLIGEAVTPSSSWAS